MLNKGVVSHAVAKRLDESKLTVAQHVAEPEDDTLAGGVSVSDALAAAVTTDAIDKYIWERLALGLDATPKTVDFIELGGDGVMSACMTSQEFSVGGARLPSATACVCRRPWSMNHSGCLHHLRNELCENMKPTILHLEPGFFQNPKNYAIVSRLADHMHSSGGLFSARIPAECGFLKTVNAGRQFGTVGHEKGPWQLREYDECRFGVESPQGASDASYVWLSNFPLDVVAGRCS